MRAIIALQLVLWPAVVMASPGGGTPSDEPVAAQSPRSSAEVAADRLEAALAAAARLPATSWKATFTETTFQRETGKPETVTDRESGTVIGSPRGFVIEKLASQSGVMGSLAVLPGPSMQRSAGGLAIYASPPPFLCNLSFVAPTVESLRETGLVARDLWGKVVAREEGEQSVYEISMKPRAGVAREEYALRFESAERGGRLCRFAWRTWREAEKGGEPQLDSEIDVTVESWATIGDANVPTRVTRSAYLVYPGEPPPPRIVQRIELSPIELSGNDATAAVKSASTPRRGELVRDYARSAEYRLGEAWIKVGGIEFDLEHPIEEIPASIPDVVKGAKAKPT